MKRNFKNFLVCGSILLSLSLINGVKVNADENISHSEQPKNVVTSSINPLYKVQTTEQMSKSIIGSRFYVNQNNYNLYKSETDIGNLNISNERLSMGRYVNIIDTKMVDNIIYYKVSLAGNDTSLGWISSENTFTFVTSDKLKKVKEFDSNDSFFTITEDTPYYESIQLNRTNKFESSDLIKKDTKVNIVNQFETDIEKDAINWYKISYKQEFKTLKEAEEFIKESQSVIKEETKDEKKVYIVEVNGWVNQLQVRNVTMSSPNLDDKSGLLSIARSSFVVKKEASSNSEDIITLENLNNTELSFSEYTTEKLENTKQVWFEIQEIDENKEAKDNVATKFVRQNNFSETKYTKIKNSETMKKDNLIKIKEDVETIKNPTGSKTNENIKKLTSGTYLYIDKKLTTDSGDVWYQLKDENDNNLGLVKEASFDFVLGETIKYTVQKDDTLESVLSKFKITQDDFEKMNIKLTYIDEKEFKEGLEIVVKAPKIKYDTSKVSGTSSGIALVKDIMYTAPIISEEQLKPSIAYAQAILESGGGTSGLSTKSNNLFGIKGTYKGQGSSWATQEDDGSGSKYTINATFRSYPNKMVSVLDYVDLLTQNSRYSKALGQETAEATITAIWEGGYATDTSYVSLVMSVVNMYDLTQFDKY